MSTESPRGRLAAEARERSAREAGERARRDGLPPGPGDLFVLAATAELPVEWAVLERREGGELLAVPADTSPLAGTGDVEVPAGEPGGPLVLRCRFGVWLDRKGFEPAQRTGVLAEETVAEALQCRRRIESGEGAASPLAEEVEADPEYEDWIREVPARARELVSGAKPGRGAVFGSKPPQGAIFGAKPRHGAAGAPRRPWRTAERLAAALAVATLGLSLYVVHLRRELGRVSPGIVEVPSDEVVLGDGTRGNTVIRLPEDARLVALQIVLAASPPERDGRVEIVDSSGKVLWQRRLLQDDVITLFVPRSLLPDGEYQVQIVPSSGAEIVIKEPVTIETAKEPAP